MWGLVVLGAFVFVALAVLGVVSIFLSGNSEESEEKTKTQYRYAAKKWFLTPSERDFYNALGMAVGKDYRIFAQVHLDMLLDEKIVGQKWKWARAHINQKSVDFVLCDKDELLSRLVIELDDRSHEREERIERDVEVERILKEAGIPLLRIRNGRNFDPVEIARNVHELLDDVSVRQPPRN